jgi:polygalacturonase
MQLMEDPMFRNVIVTILAVTWGAVVQASTIVVDLNGGADYTAIQPATDAAAEGYTVLVKPGEYVITEPIRRVSAGSVSGL